MSLRWRFAVAILLITGLGFSLIIHHTIGGLRQRYQEALEESMVDTATVLAASISSQETSDPLLQRPDTGALAHALTAAKHRGLHARIYTMTKTGLAMDVRVTDAKGIVIFDSAFPANVGKDFSRWNDVARTLQGRYGARATRIDPTDPRTAILHVAAPVMAGDRIIGVLTVIKQVDAVSIFLDAAHDDLLSSGALIAIAVIAMALVATWWISRPIRLLTLHVQAVKAGGRPVPPALGNHELGELGQAFIGLREAIDGRAYIENYVQTLTHEMKSPLCAIGGAAELLGEDLPGPERERFLNHIRAETDRLHSLVERLLQLAALERRSAVTERITVSLSDLIKDVADSLHAVLTARAITLCISCSDMISMRAERFLLRQALANLLLNAIGFSPLAGRIDIEVVQADGFIEIRVLDRGPGIPDFARERVFERFYSLPRPDTGRKSSGLGLNLVREVAVVHGGTVTLTERTGGGTIAFLRLPDDTQEPPLHTPS